MEGKKMFRKILSILSVLGGIAFAVVMSGCDRALPPEFQTKTGYPVSGPDARACALLTADSARAVFITGAVLESPAIRTWKGADDAFIAGHLGAVPEDTTVSILNPSKKDTVYAVYRQESAGTAGRLFYVSWDLQPANTDATVEISLLDRSGKAIPVRSAAMPLETAAGCTQSVSIGGLETALPKIRSRILFSLEPGLYLVKMFVSKPAAIGTFRMAVLHGA
jgi:hypothetical protein